MLRKLMRNKVAQTTAEYAILIAIVVGAVVAMQVYVRRGIQGRIRNVVDHVDSGGAADFNFTAEQYEPYYNAVASNTTRGSSMSENLGKGGVLDRNLTEDTGQARQTKTGWNETDTAGLPTP